jgi:anti-sigma regulatory factor (Ser/Thr protein kinase)
VTGFELGPPPAGALEAGTEAGAGVAGAGAGVAGAGAEAVADADADADAGAGAGAGVAGVAWPLRSHLELGALAGAVPSARLHARHILSEWGQRDQAETVELLVSELITNAVQASAGLTPGVAPVRLWLCSDRKHVLIQVWDGNSRLPVPRDPDPDPDSEGGRGLLLVDVLSAEWGAYRPTAPGPPDARPDARRGTRPRPNPGKIIWALVS